MSIKVISSPNPHPCRGIYLEMNDLPCPPEKSCEHVDKLGEGRFLGLQKSLQVQWLYSKIKSFDNFNPNSRILFATLQY